MAGVTVFRVQPNVDQLAWFDDVDMSWTDERLGRDGALFAAWSAPELSVVPADAPLSDVLFNPVALAVSPAPPGGSAARQAGVVHSALFAFGPGVAAIREHCAAWFRLVGT